MELSEIQKYIDDAKNYLSQNKLAERFEELQKQTNDPKFWDNPQEAQKVSSECSSLEKLLNTWKSLEDSVQNFEEMSEILSEAEQESEMQRLEKEVQEARINLFLSGEHDNHNAIVTLTVGAGGVDANDWTQMTLKMLLKYCERQGWRTEMLDTQDADVAGIKGATFRVSGGEKIFGYLKGENGTHRLVRPSPFNAKGTRETSFANVEVVPEITSSNEVLLEDKDLRIDTFRAQGAGGQHVNTTDSAVRITHVPSGIVVQCQNERSQAQNKASAIKVLQSRLAEKIRLENEAKQKSLKSEKVHASFGGGHIRSYVLDDRYVKDTRTGVKNSQVDKILNGELDEFVEAFLVS